MAPARQVRAAAQGAGARCRSTPSTATGQIAYLTIAPPHRPRPRRAALRRRTATSVLEASPPTRTVAFAALQRPERRPGRGGRRVLDARRAPSATSTSTSPPTGSPTSPPRSTPATARTRCAILHEDPYSADRGRRGRLRPRRRDRPRRRRPARAPTAAPRPRPSTSSARPSATATPTCRSSELRRRTAKLLGAVPDPDVLAAAPGTGARRGLRLPRGRPTAASSASPRRSAPAPPAPTRSSTTTRATSRAGGLTDEQWAAVRGAFASRISVLTGGPGVGKTVCIQAIVPRRPRRPTSASRSARRPAAPPAGCRRRPATPRRRSTA